jgi:hypothetical protein
MNERLRIEILQINDDLGASVLNNSRHGMLQLLVIEPYMDRRFPIRRLNYIYADLWAKVALPPSPDRAAI